MTAAYYEFALLLFVAGLKQGYLSHVILDEAQARQAIAMVKHGRPELDEMFLGSVTEKVLYDLDRNLLLLTQLSRQE